MPVIDASKLAAAILLQNNQAFPATLPRAVENLTTGTLHVYADHMQDLTKGVMLHKITAATAGEIATLFLNEQTKWPVPLTFALACADIESIFDPGAQNGNFAGSNPGCTLDGFDMGLCQLKLKYLIGNGITTIGQAYDVAMDPAKALPVFFRKYAGLIAWAQSIEHERSSAWNPKYGVLANATMAYNFGEDGAKSKIVTGEAVSHCDHVIDLEAWFAKQLDVAPVMLPAS